MLNAVVGSSPTWPTTLNFEKELIMEKFVPYEKLSKKEQQKINKARRGTWGDLNPVTRKPTNSKAYNRNRAQAWKKNLPDLRSYSS